MNRTQTAVTRKNREVMDETWIEYMLTASPFGVFGFTDGSDDVVRADRRSQKSRTENKSPHGTRFCRHGSIVTTAGVLAWIDGA